MSQSDVRFDARNLTCSEPTAVVQRADHVYVCRACGHEWKPRHRYLWWPVSLRWRRHGARHFFDRHGVEVGFDAIEQRVFAQVLHVGALKIRLGFRAAPAPREEPR